MLTGLVRFVVVIALGLVVRAWHGVVGEPEELRLPLIRCGTCWRMRPMGERCVCGERVTT